MDFQDGPGGTAGHEPNDAREGHAGPALLESYDPERQPIAKQTVDRAITSLVQWEPLNKALRLEPGLPTAKAIANLANLRDNTADAAEQRYVSSRKRSISSATNSRPMAWR